MLNRVKIVTLFCALSFSFFQVHSQGKLKQKLKERGAQKELAISQGKPWFSPLVGPAYTADAGLLIYGGFLYSFRANKKDSISQRSSLPATIYYSTKGNFGINASVKTFWMEEKIRFDAKIVLKDKDHHYYGKGYEEIENTYQSDSTTLYHQSRASLVMDFYYKIHPSVYAGAKFASSYTSMKDYSAGVEEDPYLSQFDEVYGLLGLGAQLSYDTRDIVVNAWSGMYVNVSAMFFDKALGSTYGFQEYEFDTRFYKTFIREGNVMAFRFFTRAAYGDVPITDLSDFAGGKNLRGYYLGHYRDNVTSFVLGEWRYKFKKADKILSKSGLVVWLGAGSIAADVPGLTKWLPNGGFGYRLELQPRMNVCVDFGFGRDTQGVYFNFVEAF